jgi:hypothetical protein
MTYGFAVLLVAESTDKIAPQSNKTRCSGAGTGEVRSQMPLIYYADDQKRET